MKISLNITDNINVYEVKSILSSFFIDAEFYINSCVDANLIVHITYESNIVFIKIKNVSSEKMSSFFISDKKNEDIIKLEQTIYTIISEMYNLSLPWGILTGVRPVKIAVKMIKNGSSDEEILSYYQNIRYLSKEKALLCLKLAKKELQITKNINKYDRALYINIPICPHKCSYCSFISKQCRETEYIKKYTNALIEEINLIAKYFSHLNIISAYIGGGTPAVLSAEMITSLIEQIRNNFNMSSCLEFTFEAGRADCINESKLDAIKLGGVDRICINAQSMHETTLEKIGRNITPSAFYEAYEKTLKYKFIRNVDLIYGLEGESENMFYSSLDKIIKLKPENITLHSLSYKRNSEIFEKKNFISPDGFDKSYDILKKHDYEPYYLYRQKYTANASENTGFSLSGYEGVYNRLIISERIGIIGLGSGAAGKIYDEDTDCVKRVAGYKNIDLYINNTSEAVNKKLKTYGFI